MPGLASSVRRSGRERRSRSTSSSGRRHRACRWCGGRRAGRILRSVGKTLRAPGDARTGHVRSRPTCRASLDRAPETCAARSTHRTRRPPSARRHTCSPRSAPTSRTRRCATRRAAWPPPTRELLTPQPFRADDVPQRRAATTSSSSPARSRSTRSACTTCCRSTASRTSATCPASGSSGSPSSPASSSSSPATCRCRSG